MTKKTKLLRNLLNKTSLEFLLEAHNGISAKIAEEAGFEGLWASGLALSAQYGVRDNNEASWTQIVDMVEFMADATTIPILLDGDTGYGNFNNMRRLVKKLEQRGIAGVCIEDKLFPKTNSFIKGEKQALADVAEFSGKIAAGKDSQLDEDFCIIARVEAFIAGWDMKEALYRAESYRKAGADGILIHSSLPNPSQILEFAQEWANRSPLVIVPTKYYSTPVEAYRKAEISVVIWANHMLRGSIHYMQQIASTIKTKKAVTDIEDDIATVNEVFRLQGADELADAEKRYFNETAQETRAIVLAASRGNKFAELTENRPKAMLPINGKPLLSRLTDRFRKANVKKIFVVSGYKSQSINVPNISLVENLDFESNRELASLNLAQTHFNEDMIILYGDLLFRGYVLKGLLESKRELTVVVDSSKRSKEQEGDNDFAFCSVEDNRELWGQDVLLEHIDPKPEHKGRDCSGRWVGMVRVHGAGRDWIETAIDELKSLSTFDNLDLGHLLNKIIDNGHPIRVIYIHGHWLNINSLRDLEHARSFM
jgi:phosphoenolpyruvate phosphomutase